MKKNRHFKAMFHIAAMRSIATQILRICAIAIIAIIGFSFIACGEENGPQRETPIIADFNISGTGTVNFDGTAKKVTIAAKTGKTKGAVTVKYNGDETSPSETGEYTVTFDVAAAAGWNAVNGLSAGTLNIIIPTPVTADYNISGAGTVYFDNEDKIVDVTARTGKSTGEVTVYYESTDKETYPKTDIPPNYFGTYNVTFNVQATSFWNKASGLSAGTLTIADGTPAAPSGLNASIQSLTSIRVSWASVARATSYDVYYITAEGMDEMEHLETVTTASFTHDELNLNIDDIYFYYITASNSYGVSDYSDFKSIFISKPPAPNSVIATPKSTSAIDLQWSAVSGATEYKVYYSIGSNGDLTEMIGTFTSTSASFTQGSSDTLYYFNVKAINPIGESDFSTAASAKTFSPPITEIVISAAIRTVFSDTIRVTVNKYSLYRDEVIYFFYTTGSPNNPKRFFDSLSLTSLSVGRYYVDELSPLPNTTYYFWATRSYLCDGFPFPVYADRIGEFVDESRVHGYSQMVSVRTGNPPPPIPPTTVTTPPAASTPPLSGSVGQRLCNFCLSGTCKACYGTGTESCSSLMIAFHKDNCTKCNGNGTVKCWKCSGSGKCSRCNGTGKI